MFLVLKLIVNMLLNMFVNLFVNLLLNLKLMIKTERAASEEPSLLELSRVAFEEDRRSNL